MKQIAQNYKSGDILLLEVPVPACKSGGILVRTDYSLISMGTEAMKIHESKLSLIGKARARPDRSRRSCRRWRSRAPLRPTRRS